MPIRPRASVTTVRSASAPPVVQRAAAWPELSAVATISLRYVKQGGIILRGPVTGRQYSFTATRPIQPVDAQDAAALLRSSWFRRA